MLSYRHGFHAGNHADVLKHCALLECIKRLSKKDAPILYVDTHAGAGSYALREGYAAMNEEWAAGIERAAAFAAEDPPPAAVASYLELVRRLGPRYPGSPSIAAAALRPRDGLALFELHPSDFGSLSALFERDRRVRTVNADGFAGLKGVLPPPSRRGLVLIDPSYELASDYDRVVAAVEDGLRRFATGVYAIWYPLLEREEARLLPGRLSALADKAIDARLRIRSSLPGERGMAGSGLVVINPPWLLAEALGEALPYLARALGEDGGATWSLGV
jgi:23S rRNA (adenine2030-N6)-methyltransferase